MPAKPFTVLEFNRFLKVCRDLDKVAVDVETNLLIGPDKTHLTEDWHCARDDKLTLCGDVVPEESAIFVDGKVIVSLELPITDAIKLVDFIKSMNLKKGR
jgi:hypothetical protein